MHNATERVKYSLSSCERAPIQLARRLVECRAFLRPFRPIFCFLCGFFVINRYPQISIVGVGLIGASIGMAAKQREPRVEITGVGRRASSLRKAKSVGAVDRTTTDLAKGVAKADLVVICTPVATIGEIVRQVSAAAPQHCLITDAGSTKAEIVADVESATPSISHFLGSHPLAGSENNGPEHGRPDLFEGRVVVITPTRKSSVDDKTAIREFWESLGATVCELSPREHDQALAATSHLPHLVAAAIAGTTPERYAQLVASGWLDTTRIAAGDPELWQQIFLANREHVLTWMTKLETQFAAFREALQREDGKKLTSLLAKAKRTRDALGN